MMPLSYLAGILDYLLLPFIIRGIQLIGIKAELPALGTDDGLVINMKRDPVSARDLLGKQVLSLPLHFLQMPLGIYYPVKSYSVKPEEPLYITYTPVGGSIYPDLISLFLESVDEFRRSQPQPLLKDPVQGKYKLGFGLMSLWINKEHLIQVKGNPHFYIAVALRHSFPILP